MREVLVDARAHVLSNRFLETVRVARAQDDRVHHVHEAHEPHKLELAVDDRLDGLVQAHRGHGVPTRDPVQVRLTVAVGVVASLEVDGVYVEQLLSKVGLQGGGEHDQGALREVVLEVHPDLDGGAGLAHPHAVKEEERAVARGGRQELLQEALIVGELEGRRRGRVRFLGVLQRQGVLPDLVQAIARSRARAQRQQLILCARAHLIRAAPFEEADQLAHPLVARFERLLLEALLRVRMIANLSRSVLGVVQHSDHGIRVHRKLLVGGARVLVGGARALLSDEQVIVRDDGYQPIEMHPGGCLWVVDSQDVRVRTSPTYVDDVDDRGAAPKGLSGPFGEGDDPLLEGCRPYRDTHL